MGHLRRGNTNRENDEILTWKAIWKLEGPPKLQHFVWKATIGAIAVKEHLYNRHIISDSSCPICSFHVESAIHALFECDFASQAWMSSSFLGFLFEAPTESFGERFRWCINKLNKTDLISFVTVAWAVWFARNQLVFQNSLPRINSLVSAFHKVVADFNTFSARCKVPQPFSEGSVISNSEWKAPPIGLIKINTDAGMMGENMIGLGMVARDTNGRLIAAAVKRCLTSVQPVDAEALAGLWGLLQVARKLRINNVIWESDALSVINSVSKAQSVLAPIGLALDDIMSIVSKFTSFSFCHVKRGGNSAAHFVARLVPTEGSEQIFVDSFPQGLLTLVGFDLHQ